MVALSLIIAGDAAVVSAAAIVRRCSLSSPPSLFLCLLRLCQTATLGEKLRRGPLALSRCFSVSDTDEEKLRRGPVPPWSPLSDSNRESEGAIEIETERERESDLANGESSDSNAVNFHDSA